MGSTSDWKVMEDACKLLDEFNEMSGANGANRTNRANGANNIIQYEKYVVSAHRTPERLFEYAKKARSRHLGVIIAGAGGAAHLPGMIASLTTLPVIGVPIKSSSLSGVDSLHSIVQMPKGVPVACVAIDGASNAALLALQMLGISHKEVELNLETYKKNAKKISIMSSNQLI